MIDTTDPAVIDLAQYSQGKAIINPLTLKTVKRNLSM